MQTAAERYAAMVAEIADKLAYLQGMAEDHFGYGPDEINWAHVGDLTRVMECVDAACAVHGMTAEAN